MFSFFKKKQDEKRLKLIDTLKNAPDSLLFEALEPDEDWIVGVYAMREILRRMNEKERLL